MRQDCYFCVQNSYLCHSIVFVTNCVCKGNTKTWNKRRKVEKSFKCFAISYNHIFKFRKLKIS